MASSPPPPTTASPPPDFFETNQDVGRRVVQFLGTKSLARFGACRKRYRQVLVDPEVARRQTIFAELEQHVKAFFTSYQERDIDSVILAENNNNTSFGWQDDVEQAFGRYERAQRLVDDECDWCHHLVWRQKNFNSSVDVASTLATMQKNPFWNQLVRLAETNGISSHPAFFVLPKRFYMDLPTAAGTTSAAAQEQKEQVAIRVTDELKAAGNHYATWIWGAEDQMGTFYEMGLGFHPYFLDPRYPFRKFEHPLSQDFCEGMVDLAEKLKANPSLKAAFRYYARELALRRPAATDCLHFVLYRADPNATEDNAAPDDSNDSSSFYSEEDDFEDTQEDEGNGNGNDGP